MVPAAQQQLRGGCHLLQGMRERAARRPREAVYVHAKRVCHQLACPPLAPPSATNWRAACSSFCHHLACRFCDPMACRFPMHLSLHTRVLTHRIADSSNMRTRLLTQNQVLRQLVRVYNSGAFTTFAHLQARTARFATARWPVPFGCACNLCTPHALFYGTRLPLVGESHPGSGNDVKMEQLGAFWQTVGGSIGVHRPKVSAPCTGCWPMLTHAGPC